jgi:hypothetical protein
MYYTLVRNIRYRHRDKKEICVKVCYRTKRGGKVISESTLTRSSSLLPDIRQK